MNLMQKISKTNATLSEGQKRGDRVSAAGRVRCFSLDGSIQPPLVLGITDLPGIPIAQKADICLIARRGFHTNVNSLTVPFSPVNALVIAVALAKKADSIKALKHLDELLERYPV